MDLSANNPLIVSKKKSLVNRGNGAVATAGVEKWSSPSAKTVQARDGVATMVEYVLLIAVGAIGVAVIAPPIDHGMIDLIQRVGLLLALGR